MSIKQILVPVQEARSADAGLKAAAVIARAHDAHVRAFHLKQRPGLPGDGFYALSPALLTAHVEDLRRALEERSASLKQTAERLLAGAGVSWEWREREGTIPFDISLESRVADVVVFGRTDDSLDFEESALIEETLFQSGAPALLVPLAGLQSAPKRVLFAWNGTREAARALSAGLAFFRQAEAVAIVTFGDPPPVSPSAAAAASLLARHGVKAETITRPRDERDADHLLQEAKAFRADLVVMGAYSHARWRQIVLGGFTRTMLKQTEAPVLLAH